MLVPSSSRVAGVSTGAVDVAVGIDRLLVLHEAGRDAGPVVGRGGGDDAVEVLRVALRRHHRLPAAARAADEVRVVRPLVVVAPDDRLGGLRRQVDRPVPEVLLPLRVVERPARVDAAAGVPCVGPHRRVAPLQGAAPVCEQVARLVLDAADEAAAAAHQEPAVPVAGLGQQQLEVDLRLDDAGHPAVGRNAVGRGHRLGPADPDVHQLEARKIGARRGTRGRRLGRRPARRRRERADGRNGGRGQETLHQSHLNPPRTPRRRRLAPADFRRRPCPSAGASRPANSPTPTVYAPGSGVRRCSQRARQGTLHREHHTRGAAGAPATGGCRDRAAAAAPRQPARSPRPTRPPDPSLAPRPAERMARPSAGGMIPGVPCRRSPDCGSST